MRPRLSLLSTRLCCEARVGLVARRARGTTTARAISSSRRLSASSRLASWVRYCCALMMMLPSAVTRWSDSASRRSFQACGSDEARMSKRRWMAEDTLLMFWPPAPWARTAVISTSPGAILTPGRAWSRSTVSATLRLLRGGCRCGGCGCAARVLEYAHHLAHAADAARDFGGVLGFLLAHAAHEIDHGGLGDHFHGGDVE